MVFVFYSLLLHFSAEFISFAVRGILDALAPISPSVDVERLQLSSSLLLSRGGVGSIWPPIF